jgi:hypothetical protein
MQRPPKRYTPVEWMHPSWRDLVIDHLASDGRARRHFLLRCGLHGFLLAVSSAGGATGLRRYPLLVNGEDWDALIAAVPRVIESDSRAAASILAMLAEALPPGSDATPSPEREKLVALAETTLAFLRQKWSANGISDPALLDRYFFVSEYLVTLPPSPDLRPTWDAAQSEALAEINDFDPDQIEIQISACREWLEFAAVIHRNEPRFIRTVAFPQQFETLITEFIPRLNERAELDFDFDDADQCREEQDRLDEIGKLADAIVTRFPTLLEAAKRVAFLARLNERRVDGIRESFEEEREPDEEEKAMIAEMAAIPAPDDEDVTDPIQENINIDKLFADL